MQLTRKKPGLLKSALLGAATLGALSLAGAGVAHASEITVNWTFYDSSQSSGIITGTGPTNAITYGTSGHQAVSFGSSPTLDPTQTVTLTPHGPVAAGQTLYLYQKNGKYPLTGQSVTYGAEQGVGLTNDPSGEGEIAALSTFNGSTTEQSYVQIDISNLSDPPLNRLDLGFTMGSVSGDGWAVYGVKKGATDTSFGAATEITHGGGTSPTGTIVGFQSYEYLDVIATSGNVLLRTLTAQADPAPEPGSLALLGTGLLGLGLVMRRRRRTA